ncbi:MAG TPA: 2-succinyl-5-enolpyruvyl-6-hydroxy-3-cyclohexene-1-carboxylic-acid synthase [Candidatus Hydrogenedentes bacterium]|nr:2-succinyl-5-enolpyruvyl-6-hydroxy-3-cyclohexene-1-carboxylic-acid synthase [Candidatus Hydrogenedentota bacterium]
MLDNAPNINHLWAGLLVEELARGGVCCFCISPGSRSTPLAMAAARHPRVPSVVHFDERGAAFHALGWASATGKPAVLICTSGSATANFWPAVVEASMSGVPLILLTADRPPELLDCGANQAIDQIRLYGEYVRWSFTLPCPDPEIPPGMVLTTVDQALYRAQHPPAGPVHLNCMFREPLAPLLKDQEQIKACMETLSKWRHAQAPFTSFRIPNIRLKTEDDLALLNLLNDVKRGLLVVGRLRTAKESEAARLLAETLQWPVFPDVCSGVRLAGATKAPYVAHYDQLLLSDTFQRECTPEFVLHLGGAITSKRLQEHLARLRPEYMLVNAQPFRQDPFHQVTHRVEMGITGFGKWLTPSVRDIGAPSWGKDFSEYSQRISRQVDDWLNEASALSEIAVARLVSRQRPAGSIVFLGNSMPIRDMDMYGAPDGPEGLVVANRGASGIDGNIATAAGYANALQTPVTAVIGDLAALHDLNSVSLLRASAAPVILVVVNNNGGGIFSLLPIAEYEENFEKCFGTPHGLTFEEAARMFGISYACPDSQELFAQAYGQAIAKGSSSLIEVRTDRAENVRAHRELQAALRTVI